MNNLITFQGCTSSFLPMAHIAKCPVVCGTYEDVFWWVILWLCVNSLRPCSVHRILKE